LGVGLEANNLTLQKKILLRNLKRRPRPTQGCRANDDDDDDDDQLQNYWLKALPAAHKTITSKTDNVCSNVTFWPSYKLFHIVNRNLVGKL
jgi:hypothetical protein